MTHQNFPSEILTQNFEMTMVTSQATERKRGWLAYLQMGEQVLCQPSNREGLLFSFPRRRPHHHSTFTTFFSAFCSNGCVSKDQTGRFVCSLALEDLAIARSSSSCSKDLFCAFTVYTNSKTKYFLVFYFIFVDVTVAGLPDVMQTESKYQHIIFKSANHFASENGQWSIGEFFNGI